MARHSKIIVAAVIAGMAVLPLLLFGACDKRSLSSKEGSILLLAAASTTDARASDRVDVVCTFSAEFHNTITYSFVLLKSRNTRKEGRR